MRCHPWQVMSLNLSVVVVSSLADQTIDPNDLAGQIAASSGPY